jgi:septal ring factor EnvC (AmiA/AmiB activator)
VNKKQIKLSLTLIILCNLITSNSLNAGNGGNVAAGVIGGLGVGALIGAAASRPTTTREVVYVENEPRPSRSSRKERELRQWEADLKQQERDLNDWENELDQKEQRIAAQQRDLDRRECAVNQRERALKNRSVPVRTITTIKEVQ